MASDLVNERAVARARQLIDARQYVLNSDWGEVQPRATEQNEYLASHPWDEVELAAHELLQHLDRTSA